VLAQQSYFKFGLFSRDEELMSSIVYTLLAPNKALIIVVDVAASAEVYVSNEILFQNKSSYNRTDKQPRYIASTFSPIVPAIYRSKNPIL